MNWIVAGLLAVLFAVILAGVFIPFLWSVTLVPLFGFPSLSFGQGVALYTLCQVLFTRVPSNKNK